MSKEKKAIAQDEKFSKKELTNAEALEITQALVKEFINTKQRMLADDKKLNIIGRALIEQKGTLEDIFTVQRSHGKELTESLENVVKKQKDISTEIDEVSYSMKSLQAAKVEQEKFVEELDHFQKRHGQLVENSKKQSEQSIERLQVIGENVINLSEHINEVDIEEQVLDIANRTAEIDDLLKSHSSKQEQARENASKTMLDLLAEVSSFKRKVSDEKLMERLTDIQKASKESKKKIDNLNEKFDTFIEAYELSKVEVKESLDDFFPDHVDFVDGSEAIGEVEDLEIESNTELEDVFSKDVKSETEEELEDSPIDHVESESADKEQPIESKLEEVQSEEDYESIDNKLEDGLRDSEEVSKESSDEESKESDESVDLSVSEPKDLYERDTAKGIFSKLFGFSRLFGGR